MAITRERLLNLMKVQCQIFNLRYNPLQQRIGTKILRQRLRGASVASYYTPRMITLKDLKKAYSEYELYDDAEEDRLESILRAKSRGKGAPKKKRVSK